MKNTRSDGFRVAAVLATTTLVAGMSAGMAFAADAGTGDAPGTGRAAAKAAAIHAAPMKANGSGVAVDYQVEGAPAAGARVSVLLGFAGISDAGGATVRLSVDGGLALVAGETTRSLPAGQPGSWRVEVVAPASGTGYLNVFTTQAGLTSATSVPVQVGKPQEAMPASGALKQGGDGEKILPMKVK